MKRIFPAAILLAVLIGAMVLAGCDSVIITGQDTGPLTTRQYDFTDFTEIEVGHAFEVEIVPSDTYSISITAGENIFEHIDVSKTGDRLRIRVEGVFTFGSPRMEAKISLPELRGLDLSGATRTEALGFQTDEDVEIDISGASTLDLEMACADFRATISGASRVTGQLTAANVSIEASGASSVDLEGSGDTLSLELSGASRARLEDLTVHDADIDMSGASSADINNDGILNVRLSGASSLGYHGSPTLGDTEISGGSSLRKR